MRLINPASTLPGPHSTTWVTPRVGERLDRLGPAHGTRRLLRECRANRIRRRVSLHIDVVHDRNRGAANGDLRKPRCEAIGRRLQQRAVKRRRYRQQHAALRAARLGSGDRALDGAAVAGDHDLPGCIEVHRLDDCTLRRFRARVGDRRVVERR